MRVFSIGGATCSGKSTFLNYAKEQLGNGVFVVGIGAIMRQRHPPEFFDGKGAMQSTEAEVWEIFAEELTKGLAHPNVRLILLDGLPRMGGQIPKLLSYFNSFIQYGFVFLHASQETRKKRVATRFPYPYEENPPRVSKPGETDKVKNNRDLSDRRVTNDLIQIHDVLAEVTMAGFPINFVSTEGPPESYCRHLLENLWGGSLPTRIPADPLLDKSIFDMVGKCWTPPVTKDGPAYSGESPVTKVIEQPHREMNSGTLGNE